MKKIISRICHLHEMRHLDPRYFFLMMIFFFPAPLFFYMLSSPTVWMRGFSTLKECNMAGFKKKDDKKFVLVW